MFSPGYYFIWLAGAITSVVVYLFTNDGRTSPNEVLAASLIPIIVTLLITAFAYGASH